MDMSTEFKEKTEACYITYIRLQSQQHVWTYAYEGNMRRGKIWYTVDFSTFLQRNSFNDECCRIRRVQTVVLAGPAA